MKVRLLLEAKKDWGTIQKGDTLILFNDIFDLQNGIAYFPIDYKYWEVKKIDRFSGFIDSDKNEIYENDYIEANEIFSKKTIPQFKGKVIFDKGCFSLHITTVLKQGLYYDEGQKPELHNFTNLKLIKY